MISFPQAIEPYNWFILVKLQLHIMFNHRVNVVLCNTYILTHNTAYFIFIYIRQNILYVLNFFKNCAIRFNYQ